MDFGEIFLIPTTLGNETRLSSLPSYLIDFIDKIDHYIVENERSARRYLKKIGIKKPIDQLTFLPLNNKVKLEHDDEYLEPIFNGNNIGIISEAGCPGIADPGAHVVKLAHKKNIKVNPLIGPSSIFLALMASGFNGQKFAFNGYLPRNKQDRINNIKKLEKAHSTTGQTQIFMETPYRNMHLLDDIVKNCSPTSLLCVAANLTQPDEFIKTQSIRKWQKNLPNIHKKPSIFIIGS